MAACRMRETARAALAFHDYFSMGANRSMARLLTKYLQEKEQGKIPPTARLGQLEAWSAIHGWQKRLADAEQAAIDATRALWVQRL